MKCEEAAPLLHPYLDGELDLNSSMTVEEHLAACPGCRQKLEAQQALVTLIQEEAPRFKPSPFLATRIKASLRAEEKTADKTPWWQLVPTSWIYSALVGVVTVGASLIVALSITSQSSPLIQEAMDDHIRSLQADHLMDVASTDQHTVKPWFMGKLDYSPQVVDLGPSGYPLIGGRLDVLDHHDVSALIYHRRKHDINLFIWPQTGTYLPETLVTRDGYHFIGWSKSGMNYLAVSDLAENEFQDFVKMIQEQTN